MRLRLFVLEEELSLFLVEVHGAFSAPNLFIIEFPPGDEISNQLLAVICVKMSRQPRNILEGHGWMAQAPVD